ncbi:GbsR/MarR family transcriptional regulator [Streptomyces sp. UNOB3_S3]|uniref:GbsR/MarR family transcriptional regulator n=1 Tax=Streptomyces sp. UNOB3_S3 TaxID=2871682 RepID=UPI001E6540D9|nr:MarR family transcriptional regulator [Streptomyces sp. UNOB3_S3]MCC3778860.1 MarR family transcriptional regulator [Streptomyces sp. UNOB3_S3]
MSETTGAGGQDPGRDQEAVSRFVERFAAELTDAGMPRMAARVYAALLASDSGVLTSAELAESLRISPAAVSGAVRYLTQVDMLGREREPGTRRDRYRLNADIWFEALTRRDQRLIRWEGVLRDGSATLGADSPAGLRIAETAEFIAFLQKEFEQVLERWREHRAKG